VRDAESHSEEDKKRREIVEIRNQADSLIYGTEKNLTDHGDKISEEDKTNIRSAIDGMKRAMEGDDVEAMKTAMQTLTTASHKLAEEMYKQTTADATGTGGTDGGGATAEGAEGAAKENNENVVDAEFEKVDKEK